MVHRPACRSCAQARFPRRRLDQPVVPEGRGIYELPRERVPPGLRQAGLEARSTVADGCADGGPSPKERRLPFLERSLRRPQPGHARAQHDLAVGLQRQLLESVQPAPDVQVLPEFQHAAHRAHSPVRRRDSADRRSHRRDPPGQYQRDARPAVRRRAAVHAIHGIGRYADGRHELRRQHHEVIVLCHLRR